MIWLIRKVMAEDDNWSKGMDHDRVVVVFSHQSAEVWFSLSTSRIIGNNNNSDYAFAQQ